MSSSIFENTSPNILPQWAQNIFFKSTHSTMYNTLSNKLPRHVQVFKAIPITFPDAPNVLFHLLPHWRDMPNYGLGKYWWFHCTTTYIHAWRLHHSRRYVFLIIGSNHLPSKKSNNDSNSKFAGKIPKWWIWGYWISPLAYGETAITVNEFLAPRWVRNCTCNI